MRLSGFTRIGALIGFFGTIGIIIATIPLVDTKEVSLKDVILAEILFGLPIFTIFGAGVGGVWDFFERRSRRVDDDAGDLRSADSRPPDGAEAGDHPERRPRRRRRRNPGGRRH